jgi:hypothetical protein
MQMSHGKNYAKKKKKLDMPRIALHFHYQKIKKYLSELS